ncbi:MAG: PQQ-binding-like beta-propeller repeat protein, partial [Dehalococcoidales bacterium]
LGWSGVAVAGDRLYFGSSDGKLVALDAANGNPDWQVSLAGDDGGGGLSCATGGSSVGIYGLPLVADELVYVSGYNGRIYAINADSGTLRWQYPREGDNALEPITGGVVLSGDNIYFGSFDGNIYALSAATGDLEWQFTTGNRVWGTPVISDGRVYIGSFDSMFYALDATSGSHLWAFDAGAAVASTAQVVDDTVFFGSLDRTFYAINASDGSLKWKYPSGDAGSNGPQGWFWAKPLIYGGAVYAPNLDGRIYVLDTASGQKLTEYDLGSPAAAAPVLVGNLIVVASDEGKVYVIDADAQDIRLLTDLAVKLLSPITAGEGIVFVHTQENETVYALDPESRVIIWSHAVQ